VAWATVEKGVLCGREMLSDGWGVGLEKIGADEATPKDGNIGRGAEAGLKWADPNPNPEDMPLKPELVVIGGKELV
jgi:hypothetical protein